MLLDRDHDAHTLVAASVTEVKTCKDDFTCPRGFMNLGDKECRGKCDKRECCEKGESCGRMISGHPLLALVRFKYVLLTGYMVNPERLEHICRLGHGRARYSVLVLH